MGASYKLKIAPWLGAVLLLVGSIFLFSCSLLWPSGDRFERSFEGLASFYSASLAGERTASGDIYHPNRLTAAHRTLPFGTRVKVYNLKNKRSVTVTINDRGPFVSGRVLDLSRRAAAELGFIKQGLARVKVVVLSTPI